MRIEKIAEIQDVLRIEDTKYWDERGFLVSLAKELEGFQPVESRLSFSYTNVFRGLHGDSITTKLITVTFGWAEFVLLDARKDSSTYGKSFKTELTGLNVNSKTYTKYLVPPGVLNGHYAKHNTQFFYAWNQPYGGPEAQFGCRWDSPEVGLNITYPILSERDKHLPLFKEL